MVRFVDDRELSEALSPALDALDAGDDVAIVADGAPRALLVRIDNGDLEAAVELVRTIRARRAIARMHAISAARGNDTMTEDEINAEIASARAEARHRP